MALPAGVTGDVNPAVQSALAGRDQSDITSGVISPDGTKMVFRTRAGSSPNYTYGLYALDLATSTGSFVQLVKHSPPTSRLQPPTSVLPPPPTQPTMPACRR